MQLQILQHSLAPPIEFFALGDELDLQAMVEEVLYPLSFELRALE